MELRMNDPQNSEDISMDYPLWKVLDKIAQKQQWKKKMPKK